MPKILFLLFAFLFSSYSYSETIFKWSYQWDTPIYSIVDGKAVNNAVTSGYRSAEDACNAVASYVGYPYSKESITYDQPPEITFPLPLKNRAAANCYLRYIIHETQPPKDTPKRSSIGYIIVRNTCPTGFDADANGTTCSRDTPDPESSCEVGLEGFFEFDYCIADGGDGCVSGTSKARPTSFCSNSCLYTPDFNPSTTDASCYSYHNQDGTSGPAILCSVTAFSSGGECSGEYVAPTPDTSCPSGTVSGELNGNRVCVPAPPDPDPDPEGGGGNTGGGDSGGGDTGGGDTGGGDSGGGDSGGGDGDGEGEGEGEGVGTGESVEFCADGRCDFGSERGDPFGGEPRSFSDSLTAAMNGMKNSPLGSSIGNIQFPTGGTCPTGSTSINIGLGSMAIDFESHCSLWAQIAPVLSAVFLALWAIIAVRVFLSA